MPVDVARMPGSFTAWDHDNSPAFLQPVYKAVTVISLVRDNILTPQIKRFQQLLRIANVITVPWRQQKPQWISQSIHYRMDFRAQSSPAASQCFVAPLFCAAAMLVDLDCGAVQHQGAPIHNVLGNQFLKNMLPNTLQAPPAKPGVHTFPRAIPFRQIPPRYSCIQPIQDSIEHYPIVFSGSSAMRRLFWQQQFFHFILLFFCQFMSLHTSILLLLP